jgi:hypothetical protein
MRSILVAGICLSFGASSLSAANISYGGAQGDDGGLLKVDQTDQYWWFCVQPDGSRGPLAAGPGGYEAQVVSLDYGWTHQTTQRFSLSIDPSTSQEKKDDLPTQVNVIEYVLDAYLPWSDTTDRFLEFNGSTDQTADVPFLNRLYASQQYIKKLYDRLTAPAFEDLSVFNPPNPFALDTPANIARHNFFDQIADDINTRDAANFFANYDAAHYYFIANTFEDQAIDPLTWTGKPDYQDGIILGGAVPEPSIGLLALGSLFALGNRRRR